MKKNHIKKIRPFRCSDESWERIQKNADKYTHGNVSAWLRIAGLSYKPNKKLVYDP